MKIMVLGGDGYLGWPTALHLSAVGHEVVVVDNFARRKIDSELGTSSLVPISDLQERVNAWQAVTGKVIAIEEADLVHPDVASTLLAKHRPESVVHFAEQRSAPYSMMDREHAVDTQVGNIVGTLNLLYAINEIDPDIHLVKLGTMGEYGTPEIEIEEGWLEVEHKGRKDRVLFPKRPGSFYHLSKVHDSHNIEFTCRVWGLRATDLNQGIVYGQVTDQTALDPQLATRLDYDAIFGTVLNRFIVQAVLGEPLTVYGGGGQTRGMLDIRDTVRCVQLACENPAAAGEFRVFNQFTESFTVRALADLVVGLYPGKATISTIDNPRVEKEAHFYKAANSGLPGLGLEPHLLGDTLVTSMFDIVREHADRADASVLLPQVRWREARAAQ